MKRRIGVLRIGSIGDHLIAVPLYRRLRELHANDELTLFCNVQEPGNLKKVGPASLLPSSLFDAVVDYPVGSDWNAAVAKLRLFGASKLECLYYLMPPRSALQSWRDRLFFALAKVPVVGLRRGAPGESPRLVAASTPLYEHETERLARGIPDLGSSVQVTPAYRSLQITAVERSQVSGLLRNARCAVAVCLGTKCNVKDWGIANWSALVARLAALQEIDSLRVVGSADEFAAAEVLRAAWPRGFENLCGRLTARQSAVVLSESRLFVGHDSGPMHMAAAVDIPVVAIFSSRALPGVWFPLTQRRHVHYTNIDCMGCGRSTCEDRKKACILRITVDEVFESCRAALQSV